MTEPITLSKDEACAYLGVSKSQFDDWRRRGILPEPIRGTRRWSREALRQAIDPALDNSDANEADIAVREWENRQAS